MTMTTDPTIILQHFTASDGTRLAYREMGQGRAVVMLHGLFSNAMINWIKYGHAGQLAAAGFRVIMPDLRAHGDSEAPHDPACYPDDVLAHDAAELIAHLGLTDYDLVGFSLGSRTSARAVLGGLSPRRLVLAGMGLAGLAGWSKRRDFFQRAIAAFGTAKHGDDVWMATQFMKTMKVDREAASLLLGSFADTDPAALAGITMPVLVLCGEQDDDNGSPEELTAALPHARHVTIPGTHMSSVTEPALGAALVAFLSEV
jgi:pimeloyl-ACP methyl ester carboxylesterase